MKYNPFHFTLGWDPIIETGTHIQWALWYLSDMASTIHDPDWKEYIHKKIESIKYDVGEIMKEFAKNKK